MKGKETAGGGGGGGGSVVDVGEWMVEVELKGCVVVMSW